MLFCNTISLHSNSHGFSSREVGWGRDTLPPSSQHSAYYILPENFVPLPKVHSSFTNWQFSQKLHIKTTKKLYFWL